MNKIPIVEMVGITKRFPGVVANDKVDLTIYSGEIHALLGENGAGKSTLMSILTGLYLPDEGDILLNGHKIDLTSPKDAVAHGIGMVHQHFKLIKPFTVAENIVLGLREQGLVYRRAEVEAKVLQYCDQFGVCIDPSAKVWQLMLGEQQRVEIAKTLFRGAEILILDEPTAVLTPQEAKELYQTLRRMAAQGKAVIVISHKLTEVLEGTDRITVLRGGRGVGTVKTADADERQLSQLMVGRQITGTTAKKSGIHGEKILELEKISCLGNRGQLAVRDVSFAVYGGEILGIAGIAGNGQSELAEAVAGLRPIETGQKRINNIDHTSSSPREIIAAGVSYVPEDRLGTGLAPSLNAVDNFILKSYGHKGMFIDWQAARKQTAETVKRFDIKLAALDNPVKMMSGGNLQKLLLAREIIANPQLLVVVYPMRGLDVGAMEAVRNLLITQRDAGKAVLFISEELDELFGLSDRIAVLHRGEVMGIVQPGQVTKEDIGLMMAGKRMWRHDADESV